MNDSAVEPDSAAAAGPSGKATRRDFLYISTAAFGAVGALASLVPFVSQMNPDAAALIAAALAEISRARIRVLKNLGKRVAV
jgi:ubiquinol-cytochrome c reductase iron-sulfur subunit